MPQQKVGHGVYFCPGQRMWRWLRLKVCDVCNVIQIGQQVQLCNGMFGNIEFMTLSGLNSSRWEVPFPIILACRLMGLRMVYLDIFKSPAVWRDCVSALKFRATERGLMGPCTLHTRSGVCTVANDESLCLALAAWCVGSRYVQLTSEASTPSHGGSLHAKSCTNTACATSHYTINWLKIK